MLTAVDLIFVVVYVRDVYSALVCSARCWKWPCPHGVRQWKLKDCPLKIFLARIEPLIEAGQPEEQHGFRPNRRLEKHLVTANLGVDKFFGIDMPRVGHQLGLVKSFRLSGLEQIVGRTLGPWRF